ncbi:MAG: hypothetical protein J07HB67_00933 [halophilic archaeon J07HB67]|jgi:hypothetical protein|nr:MAG: hypothetical protein J07HB67_00933 [halophilic archaeon J07HB67]
MCSNDSPSVKADGTVDAATLAAEYEEFLLDVEEQPLPSYRTEELRARIEAVRDALAADGVATAGQLQQLLRTVTEALADVRAARVVPAPTDRDLSAAVPGANDTGVAYEVTETERRETVNVLVDLLFTVVETPTHDDRRRAGDDGATADARDDTSDDSSHSPGIEGYAGPE